MWSVPHLQTSASYSFFRNVKNDTVHLMGLESWLSLEVERENSALQHNLQRCWENSSSWSSCCRRLSGSSSEWHSQKSWAGWMLKRMPHVSRHCLRGTSDSLLMMAKSEHFQMFHSPDSSAPHLRTQKFGLVERNKQDFLNLSWCLFSFQVFENVSQLGCLGNGTWHLIASVCIPESDYWWEHRVLYARNHLVVWICPKHRV